MSLPNAKVEVSPETFSVGSLCHRCGEFLAEHFYEGGNGNWLHTTLAPMLVTRGLDVETGLAKYGRPPGRRDLLRVRHMSPGGPLNDLTGGVTVHSTRSRWLLDAVIYCPRVGCDRKQKISSTDNYDVAAGLRQR